MVAAKMEELRVQLEKLKEEKVAIEHENESLKADQVKQDTEFNELKERMTAELRELQERNSAASAELDELRGRNSEQLAEIARLGEVAEAAESRWRAEIDKVTTDAELKRYQSVEAEKIKWEAREDRLVSELTTVRAELNKLRDCTAKSGHDGVPVVTTKSGITATTGSGAPSTLGESVTSTSSTTTTTASSASSSSITTAGGMSTGGSTETPPGTSSSLITTTASIEGGSVMTSSTSTVTSATVGGSKTMAKPAETASPSSLITTQQLPPPLTKFSGDEASADGETFVDWLEQFEMVASLLGWGAQAKLVNLVTRLKGPASSFYRSCTPEQRGNYTLLVKELSKRFVPVRIKAIQSSLFHERRQKKGESVDEYAQDLRRLYQRAYAQAQHGNPAAEAMGKSVLAYQFVSGLLPELKAEVAGTEGDFEHQLTKARFEEAKARELGRVSNSSQEKSDPPVSSAKTLTPTTESRSHRNVECRNCGRYGHIARYCRSSRQQRGEEARGRPPQTSAQMAAVVPSVEERIASLKSQLQEAEKEAALDKTVATMHGLQADRPKPTLGPILMAPVSVDGLIRNALVDTGSPCTIASLDFAMEILKLTRPFFQSLDEWKEAARIRLEPPTIPLKSYGGHEINMIGQMSVRLATPGHSVTAVIQVQKGAPVQLLLGTDLQASLGFRLIKSTGDVAVDLSQEGEWIRKIAVDPTPAPLASQPATEVESGDQVVPTHTVHLLQATKIPPRHRKLVQMKVSGLRNVPISLFEPNQGQANAIGVTVVDAIVEANHGNCITIILENPNSEPLCLKKGLVLGAIEPVESVLASQEQTDKGSECDCDPPNPNDQLNQESAEQAQVNFVESKMSPQEQAERVKKLLKVLKLEEAGLPPEQQQKLEELIKVNADIFALDSSELGSTDIVTHDIVTGDHPPVHQPPRRIPFSLRPKVQELVQDMLNQHVIVPSSSPWSSPLVLVRKKDGDMRFCVDYRRLNAITKSDAFPLPRIDDTLDLLAQNRFFSTLDLASGYWQVKMSPEAQEKTAFNTPNGLYEFVSMPFGLCNAPATFQRLMEVVMHGLARECCMVYMDDTLVLGKTFEEHLENLSKVFARLRKAKLTLKAKKCRFARREVEYLGHIVSEHGVAADPAKLKAVREFPQPTDVKSLRSFLGLASYYRRFIPKFSKIAGPLYFLTRNGVSFDWTESCQETFEQLKQLLTQSPVLAFPNFEKDFYLRPMPRSLV